MTSKEFFGNLLTELSKQGTSKLLLEDFNYFINKSINQVYNKVFNSFEVTQPITDELRVLKATVRLTPTLLPDQNGINKNVFYVNLPDDYVHLLSCSAEFKVLRNFKQYNVGITKSFGVKRLPSDTLPEIMNDYFLRPMYKRPYYNVINNASSTTYPVTDNIQSVYSSTSTTVNNTISVTLSGSTTGETITFAMSDGTNRVYSYESSPIVSELQYSDITTLSQALTSNDIQNNITYNSSNTATGLIITNAQSIMSVASSNSANVFNYTKSTSGDDFVERTAGNRYGNQSRVSMEIRYGNDASVFQLTGIVIDYMRAPQFVRLTEEEAESTRDISQKLEFPDQVCYELINQAVQLIMENQMDQRQQTFPPTVQSIATPEPPGQQQQQQRK